MGRKKLILSTGNSDKIEEIKDILKELPVKILSKEDLDLGDLEVEENGDTLEENAIMKARAIAEKIQGIVIADDTGLFVNYLNGAPGVHSARYGGEEHNYNRNNKKLLEDLNGVPLEKRSAYFETVIAIVLEDKSIKTLYGRCNGTIALEPRGSEGFGYDPLFIPEGYDKTFGELGKDIKNQIGHRARALNQLKEEMDKILTGDGNENISSKWYPWKY